MIVNTFEIKDYKFLNNFVTIHLTNVILQKIPSLLTILALPVMIEFKSHGKGKPIVMSKMFDPVKQSKSVQLN